MQRNKNKLVFGIFVCIIAAFLAFGRANPASLPTRQVILPPPLAQRKTSGVEPPYSVGWLGPHQLVVGTIQQYWYQAQSDAPWQPIPLPTDSSCLSVHYYHFTLLSDGRIGLLKECTGKPDRRWGHDFTVTLVAYDQHTHQVAQLVDQTLPDAGGFTWDPIQKRGVFTPIGIYSTLYWLTPDRVEPMPITLRKGGRSWYLPDSVTELLRYQADPKAVGSMPLPVGLARDPAWSPSGDRLVFWATLETIGQNDPFPVVPWDIYLLDPTTLTVERIVNQIRDPTHLLWSPDGQALIYISGRDWWTTQGIWRYSFAQHRSILVQAGHFSDVALSPDGNTLAATQCFDATCAQFAVWTYDIRGLVQ
jgi:WD40 repeat protein